MVEADCWTSLRRRRKSWKTERNRNRRKPDLCAVVFCRWHCKLLFHMASAVLVGQCSLFLLRLWQLCISNRHDSFLFYNTWQVLSVGDSWLSLVSDHRTSVVLAGQCSFVLLRLWQLCMSTPHGSIFVHNTWQVVSVGDSYLNNRYFIRSLHSLWRNWSA